MSNRRPLIASVLVASFLVASACGDPEKKEPTETTADADSVNVGTDAGGESTDAESDAAPMLPECADDEVTFLGGCSPEGLSFNLLIGDDSLDQLSASPYPGQTGGEPGTTTNVTVSDQCYVQQTVGRVGGTPTGIECFDAGTLTISHPTMSYDIPWNAEECYARSIGEPWAGSTVTFSFAGGADIPANSFDLDLLEAPEIEVVEDGAGGVTLTRTNPNASPTWRLIWIPARAEEPTVLCDPINEAITLSAADLQAIDDLGLYGDPTALHTGLGGAYVADGKGILTVSAAITTVTSAAW